MPGKGQPAARPRAARAWQRMLSGRRLDLLDPSALDIEIGDIAHGLARVAPPPPPRHARRDELRDRMLQLREGCEDGDRGACVRLGVIIGENRERRAAWRREHPEVFFYER